MLQREDNRDLRRCVRDLLALTTLSAYWSRADFPRVADGLADVILRSVPSQFVIVRVNGLTAEAVHEAVRSTQGPLQPWQTEAIRKLTDPLVKMTSNGPAPTATDPFGGGTVRLAVNPIGFEGDSGWVVVGSLQPDFPTRTDTLLLNTAANQAAIVLQHRRAEASLRESEERFARFMQHLPGLAWIKDSQGRYVYANDAAVRAFRMERSALYGKTDEEVFSSETAAQFKANDQRALLGGSAVQVIETLEQEDGIVHHSVVSKFAIPGPGSEMPMVGGVAIDITDRLKAEEALREANRRKDEFLATLAHELRNPLAPIRNGLQLLRLAGTNGTLLEQTRSMMDRQLQQMVRLIDDLLDVSRITNGKLELQKEWLELADIVQSAVETSRPVVEASGHELAVTLPREPIYVEADKTRLAQVFSNLLNNAAKYTDRGGSIALIVERQASNAVVLVRDNGVGIPADMLDRIFEMFMQVDRSLEKRHGGLGIGLTLVKRLVEMHDGTIEARSGGPTRGSEFVVCLPAAAAPHQSFAITSSNKDAAPAVKRRLIVADDNKDSAESLALLLRFTGNEVRTVHDGAEAVEVAAAFRPHAVLMDIGMPNLNGYEAARRIRAEPWGTGIMLIALTGWGQLEDKDRATSAGFDHHLTKPIDPVALEKLLAGSKAHQI